jgi:zinc transport system ATP-binding protein
VNDDPLLILDEVTIGHEGVPVLKTVRLRLLHGTFTALLGVNGSGKTTLLKTIAGILPPISGECRFCPIAGRTPLIGYVPQREALDPIYLLNSFEVALMGAYGRIGPGRWAPKPERDFVCECLAAVKAEDLAGKQFSKLSGGQKQRVLIARALVVRPDLLLLDEPTAGVDPGAAQAIMDVISDIHERRGLTILLVTHDIAGARNHAREVIWLRRGEIIQGPAAELLAPERVSHLLELS